MAEVKELECMLLCNKECSEDHLINDISSTKWENIKEKSKLWQGLDKFGAVYKTYNWDCKPKAVYMHKNCYLMLCGTSHRAKAMKRKSNQVKSDEHPEENRDEKRPCYQPKSTRSSMGALHKKDVCVWYK